MVWIGIVDPDQELSDQGLHCLSVCLQLLEAFLHEKKQQHTIKISG